MTKWTEVRLGTVCFRLRSGSSITAKDIYATGEVPVFGGNGIRGFTEVANFSGECAIIGRQGAYCGNVRYFSGSARMSEHAVVAVANEDNDTRFLAYLLSTMNLGRLSGQAAQPGLSVKVLAREHVRMPSIDVQRRVASTVGAFDDMIAVNRRRAAVLEEMARTIYHEWFVKFRYPGHEDVPLVDSALGLIPEGWEVRSLGSLSENFDRLRRPLSKMQRDARRGTIPYYGAAKLIDFIDDWIFDGEYLLFAEDGSVETAAGFPVLQMIRGRFWPNNHTHILQGVGVSTQFLRLAAAVVPIRPYVTGAAQPKITQANLNRIPIVIGPRQLHAEFDATVSPVFDEIYALEELASNITNLRGLLLPRLVNGQIDVSTLDLDALVEDQVAP